jgi:pyruvate dehydrogenase E2 component (dihydrolipoamide acetyltransferase)
MAHSIVMPALEMAQETGKLLAWRKKEGDTISQGDPLLDIETDKAVVEIESPASGILAGVRARAGDVVPVGRTIAWIVQPGENPPAEAQPSSNLISPKARRLAREHGIDLSGVRGSGSEGEILAEDVLALVTAVEASSGAAASAATESSSPIARLMAERTAQSWSSIPHFFVVREIDAAAMLEKREKLAGDRPEVRITYTDILISLVARTLRKHPRINSCWMNGRIQAHPEVNIGIAIAVDEGVVTVVIPGADVKKLGEIAALRIEMTERARAGRARPADLRGATFAISNLGMYNVDAFTAIIPTGQAAILAVGRIADRVVPVNGQPGIRPMMTVTLSCDHRVVDGARAAEFLNDFADAVSRQADNLS